MVARAFPFLSIVVLLFPMGVFMLGSVPLLILKHDTPTDGRFIRSLFNLYYVVLMTLGVVAAGGCTLLGRNDLALAIGGLVGFVFATRRWVIPHMDTLRGAIAEGEPTAVPRFRRLHIAGMILNVVQFGVVAWTLPRLAT